MENDSILDFGMQTGAIQQMGLAVVHGIVKSHGGNITVYSKLGEGTTFHVYLPLIETRPVEPKTVPAGPAPTGTEHVL
jgi:signal transduction histidine kinase